MDAVVSLEKINIFQCKTCKAAFDCDDKFSSHVAAHFNQSKIVLSRSTIYSCTKCSCAFLDDRDLQFHKVKHVKKAVSENYKKILDRDKNPDVGEYIKRHKCKKCDAKFVDVCNLEAHSFVHKPYPHICSCGIGFYLERDLNSHKRLVKCDQQTNDNFENVKRSVVGIEEDKIIKKVASKVVVNGNVKGHQNKMLGDKNKKTKRNNLKKQTKAKVREI